MACPTCDHTMQNIGLKRVFWCPRCGTLKAEGEGADVATTPYLAQRVRLMNDHPRSVKESLDSEAGQMVTDLPLWLWLAVMESVGVSPEEAKKNKGLR